MSTLFILRKMIIFSIIIILLTSNIINMSKSDKPYVNNIDGWEDWLEQFEEVP